MCLMGRWAWVNAEGTQAVRGLPQGSQVGRGHSCSPPERGSPIRGGPWASHAGSGVPSQEATAG